MSYTSEERMQRLDIETRQWQHTNLPVLKEEINATKYFESDAGDGTLSTEQHMVGKQLLLTLLSCFIASFISALDQTIVTTTYSAVGNKFHDFDKIGWLNSAFLVPMCTFCPIYGKLSIAFGRKYTLLTGIVVFELGSLIGGLSNSMDMLIGGRVIQGLGAGCIQSLVSIIVSESVPISKRLSSIASIALSYSIASILGPFIGGAFTSKVSWRWCYYVNLPVGALAVGLLILGYHPPKPTFTDIPSRLKKIDFICCFFLISGLVLLLVGITFGGGDYPWLDARVIFPVVFGGILFIVFLMHNFISSFEPMIMRECVTIPQLFCAATAGFCNFAMFLATVTYLVVYFQVILGHSAWQSGIDLLPLIASVTLTAVANAILTKYTRHVKLFYMIGGAFGIIGNSLVSLKINASTPSSERIGFLILVGISLGFLVQCTLLSCQMKAPRSKPGSLILVTTFVNFMRFLGGTLGVTIATLIFQQVTLLQITSGIEKIIERGVSDTELEQLLQINGLQLLNSPDIIDDLPSDIESLVFSSIMKGIRCALYLGLGFSVAAFLFSLFATNQRIPKNADVMQSGDLPQEAEK